MNKAKKYKATSWRSRCSQLTVAFVLQFLALSVSAETAQGTQTTGAAPTLPSFTATAVIPGQIDKVYKVSNQVNKPMAAGRALAACQSANPTQIAACELSKLNGIQLTTSADIKARLPEQAHPLYLWRYQSDTATVFLAGSIHILKPGFYPLAQHYLDAFEQSDTLVVEVDISDLDPATVQAKTLQYGMLGLNQNLASVMSEQAYQELQAIGMEYGLPIAQMGQFKPAMVSQQLAILGLVSVGYNPESGVDAHFLAQAGQRNIEELESLDMQLNVLLNQPLDMQSALLTETLAQMPEFEPTTAQLVTAYLSGDDAAFAEAFDTQSGTSELTRQFMYQLMDERNIGMAAKIQSYLKRQGTFFVLGVIPAIAS